MLTEQTRAVLSKLERRYATQKFDPNKKIDDHTWDAIERGLILTPSSWGLQTWKFIVVTDQKIKEELVAASYRQRQVQDCSHVVVICTPTNFDAEYINDFVEHTAKIRKVAAESLQREKNMMLNMHKNMTPEQSVEWMSYQCYIALGNLMTMASMLDIDTCPMEGFSKDEYDRILELKKSHCRSRVVCAMGYRAHDDENANLEKVRFPREKLFVRI